MHVAVADDDGPLPRQVERAVGVVGVPVVPGHELGGGVAAGEILAGNAQFAVACRTDRVDDGVVVREQFLVGHVRAHVHVEVAVHRPLADDRAELVRDALGARMIRGDACAHQPVRVGRRSKMSISTRGFAVSSIAA